MRLYNETFDNNIRYKSIDKIKKTKKRDATRYTSKGMIMIDSNEFEYIDNPGLGDCFYYALNYFIKNTSYIDLRYEITDYIDKNAYYFNYSFYFIDEERRQASTWNEYIDLKHRGHIWASNMDVVAAEELFNICINIATYNEETQSYQYQQGLDNQQCAQYLPNCVITLGYVGNPRNHYVSFDKINEDRQRTRKIGISPHVIQIRKSVYDIKRQRRSRDVMRNSVSL